MSNPTWLIAAVLTTLSLTLGASLGGIFVRRGTFASTYNLLTQKLQTYEALQRMDDHQIAQLTGARDAAIAERDAARARVARLEGMLADCEIGKADAERELTRLRAGP